jgi:hypothetical protein
MTRRLAAVLAAALTAGVCLAAGGCDAGGEAAPARARADEVSLLTSERAKAQERLEAFDRFMMDNNWQFSGSGWDVVGSYYTMSTVNGEPSGGGGGQLAMMGTPPAISITASGVSAPGTSLQTYHPSGSKLDYLLVGENIRDLAPSPWISVDTSYVDEPSDPDRRRAPYSLGFCHASSFFLLCSVRASVFRAVIQNENNVPDDPHVSVLPDGGTEMSITVPFWTLANAEEFPNYPAVFAVDSEFKALTEAMEDEPILIRIWQTAEGEPLKVELNGEVTDGTDTIAVQAGWERTGQSTEADYPQAPSALDVTYMTQDEYTAFLETVNQRRDEIIGES